MSISPDKKLPHSLPQMAVWADAALKRESLGLLDSEGFAYAVIAITTALSVAIEYLGYEDTGYAVMAGGLLSFGLMYWRRNVLISTADSVLSGEEVFMLEGPDDQIPVKIEVVQENFVTGQDRGVICLDDGLLIFHGLRTSFALLPQYLISLELQGADHTVPDSRLKGKTACSLLLVHPDHKVRILIKQLLPSKQSTGLRERLGLKVREIRRSEFLFPFLKSKDQSEVGVLLTSFSKIEQFNQSGQYPPLAPTMHNSGRRDFWDIVGLILPLVVGVSWITFIFKAHPKHLHALPLIVATWALVRIGHVASRACFMRKLRRSTRSLEKSPLAEVSVRQ